MSTSIQTILAAGKELIEEAITEASRTPRELQNLRDIQSNLGRGLSNGYGFRALGAVPAESKLIQAISLEQEFETVLTHDYARANDDTQREAVVVHLMGLGEEIAKKFINTRVGTPSLVAQVSEPTVLEIEDTNDEAKKFVIYRMRNTITYRINLI